MFCLPSNDWEGNEGADGSIIHGNAEMNETLIYY
jgi:hypothetical protein